MWRVVGTGSRKGASAPSRAGDALRQPVVWIVFAAALSLTGPRGRRAALRGVGCSVAASLIHLPLKRGFRRPRPLGGGLRGIGPVTSSFPSGHTASDLGFVFGVAQELPVLLIPLSAATMASHWSLLRARKHYPSDIVAGGAVALVVNVAAWKLRPPARGGPATRTVDTRSSVEPLGGDTGPDRRAGRSTAARADLLKGRRSGTRANRE